MCWGQCCSHLPHSTQLDAAVESLLKEMDPVYGFYGSERDDTAQCLRELLSAEQQDGAGDEAA